MFFFFYDTFSCDSLCTSNSSSEFGDVVDVGNKNTPGSNNPASDQDQPRGPGKRKKKRASYLSVYEENFRMDAIDTGKTNNVHKGIDHDRNSGQLAALRPSHIYDNCLLCYQLMSGV